MQITFYGTVKFKKNLTAIEAKKLEDIFDTVTSVSINAKEITIEEAIEDDVIALTEWLQERGNDIDEGQIFGYFGDYDGCWRYENGEWIDYDSTPVCLLNTEDLVKELIYRGYKIGDINLCLNVPNSL